MNALIKQLTVPVLIVVLTLALVYLFTTLFGPIPISVKSTVTTTSDMFTVTGTGEEKATPDKATFTVGVSQTASTAEAATEQVNETTNEIITQLKALGIEEKDIKTQNLNTFPNQDFSRGTAGTVTGYTANQDLQVTASSVDLANQALARATSSGANQISGVSFTINDDDRKKLEQSARKKAIEDAKAKANEIAADAGIRLGKVVNIYVNDQNGGPIMPFDAKLDTANRAGAEVAPDLQPGENTVRVDVTLSYETL